MKKDEAQYLQDISSRLISDLVERINKTKETLIQERVSKLIGSEFNIYEEAKRRFPRIKVVYDEVERSEHYYWNDGIIKGFLLISFFPDNIGPVDFGKEITAQIIYR